MQKIQVRPMAVRGCDAEFESGCSGQGKRMGDRSSPVGRALLATLLACAAVIALFVQPDLSGATVGEKIKAVLPMGGGQGALAIILAIWFNGLLSSLSAKAPGKKCVPIVLAILLAGCMVLGRSLNTFANLSFVTSSSFYIGLSLISFVGFAALFVPIFVRAFSWLDRCANKGEGDSLRSVSWVKVFALSLLVILACWLPYIVVGFPGTTSVDFMQQLRQFFGATELTNHHPYLMTLFFGCLFQLGYFLGAESSNAGLFAVSSVQTIAMAVTLASMAAWFARLGRDRRIVFGIVLFCGLCPLFPMFAQWCVKDTMSAVLLVNFVMQVGLKLYYRDGSCKSAYFSWPAIVVMGSLCALSRNNCAYVIVPTLFALAVALKGNQKIACFVSTALVALMIGGWSVVALPALGIKAGSISEALSLPLLQTTRCIELRYDSLTPQDRQSLQAPCDIPIEKLPEYYSVQISDQVKARYKFVDGQLGDYAQTYVSLALRNPDIYISVALAKTFGYWYPAATDEYTRFWYEYAPFTTSIMSPSLEADLINDKVDLSDVVYQVHSVFPELKTDMRRFILDAANTPLGMLLFSAACYVWICLTFCIYLVSKKRSTLLLIVPVLLITAICCISPLNGSIRYALPLVCLTPLLLGFAMGPDLPRADEAGA